MSYDTINTLPQANASFLSDLQAFLRSEVADYIFRNFGNSVLKGGYGGTSANLTHNISEVEAFVDGHWVNNAQVSHTYTASKRTWVFLRADDEATVSFGVAGEVVSYDGHFVFCEVPAGTTLVKSPSGTVPLLEVDTDDTSITTVTDLRKCRAPVEYYGTLADAVNAIGSMAAVLYLTERTIVDADVTVPSNITLDLQSLGRGEFVIDSGVTLTINGPFEAGLYQVFSGNGSIVFGSVSVTEAYPEWWGIDGVADEVQINAAITSLTLTGGNVLLTGSYIVNDSINAVSNVNLIGIEGTTTISVGTAYINALAVVNEGNIVVSGISWVGSGSVDGTERLIYVEPGNNIKILHCTFEDSLIAVHLQTVTKVWIEFNKFTNILRKSDYTLGYGVVAGKDSEDVYITHNKFYSVGRHCIYVSSGTSNTIVANNIITEVTGTPIAIYSLSSQNRMYNIQVLNNIINGVRDPGGGVDGITGIEVNGNVENFVISSNQIYDIDDAPGHLITGIIVHTDLDYPDVVRSGIISNNLVDTIDNGDGIRICNAADLQITGNHIKNLSDKIGINISASGTGTSSFVSGIIVENNIISGNIHYGVNISGVDASHKATDIILGDNYISDADANYHSGTIDYIEYVTKQEKATPTFYVDNVTSGQTDVQMSPTHPGEYQEWIAPFSGMLYSIFARINGLIDAGSITFTLTKNSLAVAKTLTLTVGDLYKKEISGLDFFVDEGDVIGLLYTTTADFSPSGSRDIIAGVEISRDVSR